MSRNQVSLIIAEAALEVVPKEIRGHPSVKNHALRLGKKPNEILLDRSFHHTAMISGKLKLAWKRGRPDITHFALIEALSTPLYIRGMLRVYIHTIDDKAILIGEKLRIPKSYFRFEGLMMKLYKDKTIRNNEGNKTLLELHDNTTFQYLIKNIVKPDKLIGLTSLGVQSTAEEVILKNNIDNKNNDNNNHCAFIVGGFPKGHFSTYTSKLFYCSYSIEQFALESHVVIARILYECEKVLSVHC
jgi:rRNA small subunit pseudouridine methyltransferase Nep1